MTALTRRPDSDIIDVQHSQPAGSAMVEVASSRSAQEVQAAMIIAKRFPRDYIGAHRRIMESCKRPRLAEQAMYAYPRGGETVTGPSIRLAEEAARQWGNLDFGLIELEQRNGESTVMAYCWDLETNTRQTKIFQVKHERHTRKGITNLSDPRDIYELVANQGARRLRACILGIIPGDIIEEAVESCERTLTGKSDKPLIDRLKAMVAKFAAVSVSQEMIEARLRHRLDVTTEIEVVQLGKIYKSIMDGMAKVEDFFGAPGAESQPDPNKSRTQDLADKLAGPKSDKSIEPAKAADAQEQASESTSSDPEPKPTPAPKSPAGGSLSPVEQLVIRMAEVNGCTDEQATASLEAWFQKQFKGTLGEKAGKPVCFDTALDYITKKAIPLV